MTDQAAPPLRRIATDPASFEAFYRKHLPPRAWLIGIARHVVASHHRSRAREAAAVALTLIVAMTAVKPTPAFAVSGGVNGKVKVHVNRLEGAPALERALRKHGIPADITYLPDNTQCAPGRYEEVRTPGLMLSVGADWFEVKIPAGAVGKGDSFVLSASVIPERNGFSASVDFGIANGTVAACQVVPVR